MTDEPQIGTKCLGKPTVEQGEAVYGSLSEPTVRGFHAKLLELGYGISLSGAQRFIATHIRKSKPQRSAATIGAPLTSGELDLIQKDLAELQLLDTASLKAMLDKELLAYSIMLMRFSQRNADRLAMAPKDSAAMVKSMTEASGKIIPFPLVMPNGEMIDVTPHEQNEVSSAISMFLKQEGVAN